MLTVKFHVDLYLYAKAPQMKKLLISISSLALLCYLGTELFEYTEHQQAIENSVTAKKSKSKVIFQIRYCHIDLRVRDEKFLFLIYRHQEKQEKLRKKHSQ